MQVTASSYEPSNIDMIRHHVGMNTLTRANDGCSIVPYVYEGDTVMYVVNYAEGWELLSNDTSVPMVLAHAQSGSYIQDS